MIPASWLRASVAGSGLPSVSRLPVKFGWSPPDEGVERNLAGQLQRCAILVGGLRRGRATGIDRRHRAAGEKGRVAGARLVAIAPGAGNNRQPVVEPLALKHEVIGLVPGHRFTAGVLQVRHFRRAVGLLLSETKDVGVGRIEQFVTHEKSFFWFHAER